MNTKAGIWSGVALVVVSTRIASASAQIGEGVLIDAQSGRVYVMSPGSAVEALRATDGKVVWRSNLAAKPLALEGGVLVAQGEPKPGERTLQVVLLTPDEGKQKSTSAATLPQGVEARIDDGLGSRFMVRAHAVATNAFISWEHHTSPMRGMPTPQDKRDTDPAPGMPAALKETEGTLKLDLQTGAIAPVQKSTVPEAARSALPMVRSAAPGEAPDPMQRLSADGRHLIKSRLVADDGVFEKYEWSIVDNNTKQVVGRLRSHLSHASFVVLDSRIVFETGPFERRTEAGTMAEPLKVRAVDLSTGKEAWSREVRDTEYRGPFPP